MKYSAVCEIKSSPLLLIKYVAPLKTSPIAHLCSSFRLGFGGAISRPLSISASSAEVQAALTSINDPDDPMNVVVSQTSNPSGGVAWRVTFLSHLKIRRNSRHVLYMPLTTVYCDVVRRVFGFSMKYSSPMNQCLYMECSRGRTFDGRRG